MIPFTWQIESIDPRGGCMVVRYTPDAAPNIAVSLNIPMAVTGSDVAEHVKTFAPANEWNRVLNGGFEPVEIGLGGAGVLAVDQAQGSEAPVLSGSWNEEYLRAMIYQVLEEMKESAV